MVTPAPRKVHTYGRQASVPWWGGVSGQQHRALAGETESL